MPVDAPRVRHAAERSAAVRLRKACSNAFRDAGMHPMLTVERQDTRHYSARLAHLQVNVVPTRANATIEFRLPTAPAVGAVIPAVVVLLCTVASSAAAPPRILSASSDAQDWTPDRQRTRLNSSH